MMVGPSRSGDGAACLPWTWQSPWQLRQSTKIRTQYQGL